MSEKIVKKSVEFSFEDVKEKPTRAFRKGSKYDKLLDAFASNKKPLVEVRVEKLDANYLRTQLHKRITSRKMNIKVSVINDVVYLEKELTVNLKA